MGVIRLASIDGLLRRRGSSIATEWLLVVGAFVSAAEKTDEILPILHGRLK